MNYAIVKIKIINFQMNAWKKFICLNSTTLEGTKKILMLTPHNTLWEMAIYEQWVHMFNPKLSQGLKIHVNLGLDFTFT
jgi:hypothetical protein